MIKKSFITLIAAAAILSGTIVRAEMGSHQAEMQAKMQQRQTNMQQKMQQHQGNVQEKMKQRQEKMQQHQEKMKEKIQQRKENMQQKWNKDNKLNRIFKTKTRTSATNSTKKTRIETKLSPTNARY